MNHAADPVEEFLSHLAVERRMSAHTLDAYRRDLLALREREADEFYAGLVPSDVSADRADIMRRAFAGMIWCKQFFRYDVSRWLDGDPTEPPPPPGHALSRNGRWRNLDAYDVMSMPDSWEYPWFAAWDLAFHTVVFSHIDAEYAKYQLLLMLREWYMHPNGALPAYEWNFDDVNPPVHAWAAWRIYKTETFMEDPVRDRQFLEEIFHKLLLNFTWWVNRIDAEGNNVFEGGFLGLDNIGPVDRSHLPPGYRIEQAGAIEVVAGLWAVGYKTCGLGAERPVPAAAAGQRAPERFVRGSR